MSVFVGVKNKTVRVLAESLYDNPVIIKDFRTRMRGWKPYTTIAVYVCFLAIAELITFISIANIFDGSRGIPANSLKDAGMMIFTVLNVANVILLALIIPSITSTAITAELEKKTIEMLALTNLTPLKIAFGRHLSGFLFCCILLVCSVPLAAMCLLFGGISPGEIFVTYLVVAAWCFLTTAGGVYWSSLFLRSAVASVTSYATCWAFLLLTLPLGFLGMNASHMGSAGANNFIFAGMNPFTIQNQAMNPAKVCGISIPISLAAIVVFIMIGVLLTLTASTHIKFKPAKHPLAIRVLMLSIFGLLTWLIMGNIGYFIPNNIYILLFFGTIVLVLLWCFSFIFATGVINKPEKMSFIRYAFSFKKIFKDDIGGGIPFMMLFTFVIYSVLGITIWWVNTASLTHTNFKSLNIAYLKMFAATIIMIVGISAFAVFSSSINKMRRNAAASVILFLLFAYAFFPLMSVGNVVYNKALPLYQTAVLWPMTPFLCAAGEWSRSSMPKLAWPLNISWLVCGIAYLVFGIISLLIADIAFKKTGGIKEEE